MRSHHEGTTMATRQHVQRRHLLKTHRQNPHLVPSSSLHRSPGVLLLLVALLSWTSLLGSASAAEAHGDRQDHLDKTRSARLPELLLHNKVDDTLVPTWNGDFEFLLVDTSEPPTAPPLMPPAHHGDATKTDPAPPSKRSGQTDPKASGGFQVPTPFDSALSNNFTTSCAGFFKTMLKSNTVTECHPFSLMLQTSNSLFQASKSFVRITQTLEATCAANSTQCQPGLDDLARQLLTDAACKVDYDNNNPQVVQAFNGLIAYKPMYLASCLRDAEGDYCYANAVTNITSQGADAVPYYLPLGVNMPGGSRPTCNTCLQDEMAIFSSFAANTTQPISQTYGPAAQTISMYCGTTFVNVTAAPLKGAASASTATFTPTISLLIMFLFYLFQ